MAISSVLYLVYTMYVCAPEGVGRESRNARTRGVSDASYPSNIREGVELYTELSITAKSRWLCRNFKLEQNESKRASSELSRARIERCSLYQVDYTREENKQCLLRPRYLSIVHQGI